MPTRCAPWCEHDTMECAHVRRAMAVPTVFPRGLWGWLRCWYHHEAIWHSEWVRADGSPSTISERPDEALTENDSICPICSHPDKNGSGKWVIR